jgi:hypothetical protein
MILTTGQRSSVLVVLMTVFVFGPTGAQDRPRTITVGVDIDDSTKQFSSAFAAALRQLGDIQVVPVTDRPDYVLEGVVMCSPDCERRTSYVVSLRFYSPVNRSSASSLANLALRRVMPTTQALRDSVEEAIWRRISFLESSHGSWVATWGRNRYEQAIREHVREIDASCFERVRAERQAMYSADSSAVPRYLRYEESRKWLC